MDNDQIVIITVWKVCQVVNWKITKNKQRINKLIHMCKLEDVVSGQQKNTKTEYK